MAHFYGKLQGNRRETTRTGSKVSGMVTYCASWTGAVRCYAYVSADGVDSIRVEKVCWKGTGEMIRLYDGPIGEVKEGQAEVFGSREIVN